MTGGCAFAQNQVTVRGRCLSFNLQPSTQIDPIYGAVTTYFSTFDGRDDIPPLRFLYNGNYYYNGEVRPIGSGIYAADYIKYSTTYGYLEHGYFTAALANVAPDADENGIPDFLQLENAVNLTVTVTKTRIWPSAGSLSASMILTRSAGQVFGTFTGVGGSAPWGLAASVGTGSYTRSSANTISLSLYSANFTGVATHTTSATSITVNSTNRITTAAFTVTEDAGTTNNLPSFIFTRHGTHYTAPWDPADWYPYTDWPDYNHWIIEIIDPNDTGTNGIPDLSDTPIAPTLKFTTPAGAKTITLTGQPSHKYTTYYSTDLKTWQLVADLEIVTGTNKVSFNHGTTDGKGFYRATFP